MSDLVTIKAFKRLQTGKSYNRKLKAKGLIPANLQEKGKSTCLELDPKWLSKAWLTGKRFLMEFDGQTREVSIHELQVHPVKRYAQHVDLMYV